MAPHSCLLHQAHALRLSLSDGRVRAGSMAFGLYYAMQLGHHQTYNRLARGMHYALKNGPQHLKTSICVSTTRRIDLNRLFKL